MQSNIFRPILSRRHSVSQRQADTSASSSSKSCHGNRFLFETRILAPIYILIKQIFFIFLKKIIQGGPAPQKPSVPPAPSAAAVAAAAVTPASAAHASTPNSTPAAAAPAPSATTPKPDISYDASTPVPSQRKVVKTEQGAAVQPRDYAEKQGDITRTIDGIFAQIKSEFHTVRVCMIKCSTYLNRWCKVVNFFFSHFSASFFFLFFLIFFSHRPPQIDEERARLNADKAAFAQEKKENEDLFARQQKELQDMRAVSVRMNERYIQVHVRERITTHKF